MKLTFRNHNPVPKYKILQCNGSCIKLYYSYIKIGYIIYEVYSVIDT